ncbi:hypothetical protein CGCFRS4_v015438 [Colletotrichum fructicola]|nr:hypothetical protein CGCFRS4_v015438 [Colletotrichum fructicola]
METSSARLETMTTSTTVDISAAVSSSRMANGAYSVPQQLQIWCPSLSTSDRWTQAEKTSFAASNKINESLGENLCALSSLPYL